MINEMAPGGPPETQMRNEGQSVNGLPPQFTYESQRLNGRERAPETHFLDEGQSVDGLPPQARNESQKYDGRESPLPAGADRARMIARLLQRRRRSGRSPSFRPHFFLFETAVRILLRLREARIRISNLISSLVYDHGVGIEEIENTFIADALIMIKQLEDHVSRNLKYLLEENELARKLTEIPGVGHDLAAQFIAEVIDLRRFRSLRSLYHYAGLHVVDGHAPTLRDMAQGKTTWNQRLRTIMYKIVMQALRAHARRPNKYGELYYEARKRYEERGDFKNKLHLHLRATRIVAKKILRDLYRELGPKNVQEVMR